MASTPQSLNLALIGYGKMGRMVETAALQRHHKLVSEDEADVCIDFTHPDSAVENIKRLSGKKKNIIMGTTGWYDRLPEVQKIIEENQTSLLYSANFSLGVNLFLQIVEEAAKKFLAHSHYSVGGIEMHHSEKKDAPSGTALSIEKKVGKPVNFTSVRCGSIPGTHTLFFDSPVDVITLTHEARSREGFALGAVQAAEWLHGKKSGLYTMEDLFK